MNAKKQTPSVRATTLAAPSVTEADDNNHVAATVTAVTVVVPVWSAMAAGDRVDLQWNGDVTGTYTDYVPVTAVMVSGKVSPTFSVPSAEIASNHEAAISYVVTPASGGGEKSSDVYTLSIGEAELLPAPTVDEADGTTISVDDNPGGVTVRVPATANLAAGDVVTVYWTGTDGTGTTSSTETVSGNGAGKPLTFHIAADVLEADAGTSVKIYYTVTKASGSLEISAVAVYDISGEAPSVLPAPTVAEADNTTMKIDPADVTAGVTVIIPAAANLAAGDTVSASVSDVDGTQSSPAHTVTAAEAGKALSLTVTAATLADETDGNTVNVWYTVTRAGSAEEDSSVVAAYDIQRRAIITVSRVYNDNDKDFKIGGPRNLFINAIFYIQLNSDAGTDITWGCTDNNIEVKNLNGTGHVRIIGEPSSDVINITFINADGKEGKYDIGCGLYVDSYTASNLERTPTEFQFVDIYAEWGNMSNFGWGEFYCYHEYPVGMYYEFNCVNMTNGKSVILKAPSHNYATQKVLNSDFIG